jgi:hypothetical protein
MMAEQETSDYWRGYHKAEDDYRVKLEETLLETSERLDELTASIAVLRETMDASIRHLASHVSHLAMQISIDHRQNEEQP